MVERLTIPEPAVPPLITEAEYFSRMAIRGEALKPLGKPCHECAVTNGFYREISDALARQPEPIKTQAALRWWCHCNAGRACRGNLDNIAAAPTTGGDA